MEKSFQVIEGKVKPTSFADLPLDFGSVSDGALAALLDLLIELYRSDPEETGWQRWLTQLVMLIKWYELVSSVQDTVEVQMTTPPKETS